MARTGTAHREQPPLPPLSTACGVVGGSTALRNALNRRNRGVGGPRDEDGDWRGICLATTIRAGRRDTAAASCLFFHAVFFTPCPRTRTRIIRCETRTAATPPGMNTYGGQCIDVRTRRLRDRHSPLDIRHPQFLRFFLSSSFLSRLSLDRYQLSLSDVIFKIEIPFANKFHYAIIFRRNLDTTIPKLFRRIIDF